MLFSTQPFIASIQAKAEGLSSQNSSLQVALQEAREEIVARIEHEVKLTSQFQVSLLEIRSPDIYSVMLQSSIRTKTCIA